MPVCWRPSPQTDADQPGTDGVGLRRRLGTQGRGNALRAHRDPAAYRPRGLLLGRGQRQCAERLRHSRRFRNRDELYPDGEEWINPGDSVVIAPGGEIVAGPLRREQEILFAELDPERVGIARRSLDVVGHYARPDIFQLHVNTRPQSPVEFE